MGKHLITATIRDRKGNVLSRAVNNYLRTHPVQAKWAEATGNPTRIFLHAEISALVKLRKDDRPYSISIERYTKDGLPALAKPCAVCEAALKHWGISHVSYTI